MDGSKSSGPIIQNLRKYGNPPYVVAVIHGGPGAAGEMASVATELSSTCGILEPLQTASSIEGQVRELHSALDMHASLPVTLIGHSWGAWLTLIFAARYPSFVAKLILVGSGPLDQAYASRVMETRLHRLNEEDRAKAQVLLTILDHESQTDGSAAVSQFTELIFRTDNYEPLPSDCQADPPGFDINLYRLVWKEASRLRETGELVKLAAQIRCPAVAIHGEYDPHPYEGIERPLSHILANFRFFLLRNCGHTPWMERTAREEFYTILRNELNPQ